MDTLKTVPYFHLNAVLWHCAFVQLLFSPMTSCLSCPSGYEHSSPSLLSSVLGSTDGQGQRPRGHIGALLHIFNLKPHEIFLPQSMRFYNIVKYSTFKLLKVVTGKMVQ